MKFKKLALLTLSLVTATSIFTGCGTKENDIITKLTKKIQFIQIK